MATDVENLLLESKLALEAATIIGKRSCNPGDHLHYANHDRIIREIDKYLAAKDKT